MATEESLKAQGLWCWEFDCPQSQAYTYRHARLAPLRTGPLELVPSPPRTYPEKDIL